jgi:hypothetical protein
MVNTPSQTQRGIGNSNKNHKATVLYNTPLDLGELVCCRRIVVVVMITGVEFYQQQQLQQLWLLSTPSGTNSGQ